MNEPIKPGVDLKSTLRSAIRALIRHGYYSEGMIDDRVRAEIACMLEDRSLDWEPDPPFTGKLIIEPRPVPSPREHYESLADEPPGNPDPPRTFG